MHAKTSPRASPRKIRQRVVSFSTSIDIASPVNGSMADHKAPILLLSASVRRRDVAEYPRWGCRGQHRIRGRLDDLPDAMMLSIVMDVSMAEIERRTFVARP